jgi:hypothetical protein
MLGLGSVLYESSDDPKGRARLVDEGRRLIVRERQKHQTVPAKKGYAVLEN